MLVPMTRLRILGRRTDVEPVLRRLQRLGLVQLTDTGHAAGLEEIDDAEGRSARRDQLRLLLGRIDELLAKLPGPAEVDRNGQESLRLAEVSRELDDLAARVETAQQRLEALHQEALILPDYLTPLERLLPLVPELADLDTGELGSLHLATAALVVNSADDELVDLLRAELARELGARFELVWTRVDDDAIGALAVYPRDASETVRALLGQARVRTVNLPGRFEGLSLHEAVREMRRRVADLPAAVAAARDELRAILAPKASRLATMRATVAAELERLDAVDRLAATRRGFVASCWVPRSQLVALRAELDAARHPVVGEEIATSTYDPDAPVLLRNGRLARSFEPLVRFLDLPRAGSIDPTLLMTLVLPVMLGAMVGDVGYGLALLVVALIARRRRPAPDSEVSSLTWLLLAGAIWSILFGVLFGEFLGDLGKRVVGGDWALWRYRGDAAALEPLLLLSVLAGAVHVVLGLALGAWQAIRDREHRVLLDKLGMLLALAGLFGIAARVADRLPPAAAIASTAALVVGLALTMSLHGALGVAIGPLDLLGRIGNILSYLRLAAVGLASAHLAGVANELGTIGPIWIGVIVAAVFHVLNLALAAFDPTIQALRLHYVEFFGAFFLGGGKAFTPFGRVLQRAGATS
jgi:V/A-type H+/Na+-transporting ATPase subunit I